MVAPPKSQEEIMIDLRTHPLSQDDTGALYKALVDIADHEVELLTAISFDGFILKLHGQRDEQEKVLASLRKRLGSMLDKHLELAVPLSSLA